MGLFEAIILVDFSAFRFSTILLRDSGSNALRGSSSSKIGLS